jgi:hypothetical protein
MGSDALDVLLSFGTFAALWLFVAVDRPRLLDRLPSREPRVDATGVWALRALVFGPAVLPFYLLRTRRLRGAGVGLGVLGVLVAVLDRDPIAAAGVTSGVGVLVAIAAIVERRRWGVSAP